MKVLLICTQSPWPPSAGARLRTWGWMRTASQVAELGLVTLTRTPEEREGLTRLRSLCSFVRGVHVPRTLGRKLRDVTRSLATGTPYLVQSTTERRMRSAVHAAIRLWRPDLVQGEMIGAMSYLPLVRRLGIPFICSMHNVENRILAGPPDRPRSPWVRHWASRMRRCEMQAARGARTVVAVSEDEARWFRKFSGRVFVIPNAIDCDDYPASPPPSRRGKKMVFVGHLRYPPNRDAVKTLVVKVLPLIRRDHPDLQCLVAGREPGKGVRRFARLGADVLGPVRDIREVWRQASLIICPLRWGAGSRLKLLEAAACGVPIIATGMSAAGLDLKAGRDFLQAEDPDEMAAAATGLLADPDGADRLARRSYRTVREHHHWPLFREKLAHIYEQSLAGHHR